MQELRFVAVSEDGSYAVLAVPGRSARYVLPIDEKLRAVALGQTSRLTQYEIEVESPLRPKEIQARIRAGETAEEIADAAGIPVERVRWFEGPVLAERAYIAQQAQTAVVRRQGDGAGPGPRLGDIVSERMSAAGADPEDGQWDSRKRGDGNWQVQLTYSAGGRLHIAEWLFEPRRRHVLPEDDAAARLSLPESELPPLPASLPGEATVTPIASRLGAAAGMGGGMSGGSVGGMSGGGAGGMSGGGAGGTPAGGIGNGTSGSGRFRQDRPVTPDRNVASERPPAAPPVTPLSVPAALAFTDTERSHVTPPVPAVPDRPATAPWRVSPPPEFLEEPEPALASASDPGTDYPAPPAEAPAADPAPTSAPEPAPGEATVTQAPAAKDAAAPSAPSAPAEEPASVPEPAASVPHPLAPVPEPPATTPEPAATAPEPPATAPEPAATAPEPAATAPEPAASEPEAVTESAEAIEPADAKEPASAKEKPAPAETAETADPASAEPPATAAAAEPAAGTEPPAAVAEPAAGTEPAAAAEPAGKADPVPDADEQPTRPRPAKKNPRNRRSSVPSWDEIMLGSSRQRD
jgi:hypothetical protein